MAAWRFYVYELMDGDVVRYVGKGSGRRLQVQCRKHGMTGREVARFCRESDAYAFERQRIAETAPCLNRHPGGNGSRATKLAIRRERFEIEIDSVGSRKYAGRLLLKFAPGLSKVDRIREIANGPRR